MLIAIFLVTISGAVPRGLIAPSEIAWVTDDESQLVTCQLSALSWSCEAPQQPRGIIVVTGANGIAYRMPEGDDFAIRPWGRLLVVQSDATPDADPVGVSVSAWMPERSQWRTNTKRLDITQDRSIDVVRVSQRAFWVAGDETDRAGFVRLDVGQFASTRIMWNVVRDADFRVPLVITPTLAATLRGHVRSSTDSDVDGTDVELFEPLIPDSSASDEALLEAESIRIEAAKSDAIGDFAFDSVGAGPFVVVVTDAMRGRGTAVVRLTSSPVTIRLTPPRRARGRVLRQQAPAIGTRVRLLPDPAKFLAATDARDLATIDVITDLDGRFSLPLPPQAGGELQFVGADGGVRRVALPSGTAAGDVDLGDISLPGARRAAIRLAATGSCTLTAVGPVGGFGLRSVAESSTEGIVHWLDVPEPGSWTLNAECDGRTANIQPSMIFVADEDVPTIVDARVIR